MANCLAHQSIKMTSKRLDSLRRLVGFPILGIIIWLAMSSWASPVSANSHWLIPITQNESGQIVIESGPAGQLTADCDEVDYFLGILPPWHRGIDDCDQIRLTTCTTEDIRRGDCVCTQEEKASGECVFTNTGWIKQGELESRAKTQLIVTNVISIMTRLAGLIAVIGVIIAGFKYVLSDGNSQKASGALKSLIHALSGLVVAIAASLIVEAIFRRLTGQPVEGAGLPQIDQPSVTDTIGFVMLIIGLIALLMIVLQGMRYALSQGNPEKTAQAKNGIIYSLVGVLVAFSSWGLVQFVLGRLVVDPDPSQPGPAVGGLLGSIIGIIVFIVGVISIIMVIVGGYKYIFSQGNSDKAAQARATIIYALVGVVISIMAGPILAWVLGRL